MTEKCLERSDAPYITYCMACRDRFVREGRESRHILELLYGTNAVNMPDIGLGTGGALFFHVKKKGRIEREIKISLTQEQYKTAEKLFQWNKIIEQTNFYYIPQRDSVMTSIRVRQIGEKYFLQLKAPISENGALHVKKEYEQQLDSLPEKLTAQELSQLMGRDFPAADLAGSLYTQRKLCTDFDHVEICLDKSKYLGLTDYELELEYTADYPEKPLEILKNAGITQGEAVIGKYARFMERAKKLGKC